MNAVLKSPLAQYVQQIAQAPQYLTENEAKSLLEAINATFPTLVNKTNPATGKAKSPQELLADTLVALNETIAKMQMAAATAEGGVNPTDLKKIVDAQEKHIKLLVKLSETITANERMQALENALMDALDEAEDKPLKERFLTKLRQNLAKAGKKVGELS